MTAEAYPDLIQRLRRRLSEPLPGLRGQVVMAPRPRTGWQPGCVPPHAKPAAVLALLFPRDETVHLLLTVRRQDLPDHAGQVSLPGGAMEPGEDPVQAARREAWEEAAVPPDRVHILGSLTPLYIPVSRFVLHPVVGAIDRPCRWSPQPAEVERIVEAPWPSLIDPACVAVERWRIEGRCVVVPRFRLAGITVWGATAMVLSELLSLAGHPPDPWAAKQPPAR